MSQRETKGEATIIGYVLLIVLAITLGIVVYGFMEFYVPKEKVECPSDVSLRITRVECSNQNVNITILNSGLFTVNGAYIKAGLEGRVFKEFLNCVPGQELSIGKSCDFNDNVVTTPLLPGESINRLYAYTNGSAGGRYEIEVQPLIRDKSTQERVVCENVITSQVVTC